MRSGPTETELPLASEREVNRLVERGKKEARQLVSLRCRQLPLLATAQLFAKLPDSSVSRIEGYRALDVSCDTQPGRSRVADTRSLLR